MNSGTVRPWYSCLSLVFLPFPLHTCTLAGIAWEESSYTISGGAFVDVCLIAYSTLYCGNVTVQVTSMAGTVKSVLIEDVYIHKVFK